MTTLDEKHPPEGDTSAPPPRDAGLILPGTKPVGRAAAMSLVAPGLGHLYLGQIGKGLLLLGMSGGTMIAVVLGAWLSWAKGSMLLGGGLISVAMLALTVLSAVGAIDTNGLGQKLQDGEAIGKWQWFWQKKP